jgi:hypothetical protein
LTDLVVDASAAVAAEIVGPSSMHVRSVAGHRDVHGVVCDSTIPRF